MLKIFNISLVVSFLSFIGIWYYGSTQSLTVALILTMLEISISFDNAIINASILRHMSEIWQRRFLTWGIIIAVFCMRLILPIAIVAIAAPMNLLKVIRLALYDVYQYKLYLTNAHTNISAFGGMFIFMVFVSFLLNSNREIYWITFIEKRISILGKVKSIEIIIALIILLILQDKIPNEMRTTVLISGILGISSFVLINSITKLMNNLYLTTMTKSGLISFLYLEILDASFSFDGVVSAFAITTDIIIIITGLGIGAFFVRSLTILLVRKKILEEYIYLEHGAHYALGFLSMVMLYSIVSHLPEIIIGSIGLGIIFLSFISSLIVKKYLDHKKTKLY